MTNYNLNKTEFGNFVSSLRKEKGITQKELARQLFVSDKAVSKWETGQSIPDVALLIPLAEILGVTVTELLECHRMEETLRAEDVEKIVKKAVSYKETEKNTVNKKWIIPYSICAMIAIVQMYYYGYVGLIIYVFFHFYMIKRVIQAGKKKDNALMSSYLVCYIIFFKC